MKINTRYAVAIDKAYKNYHNTYPDSEKTFQYEGSNIEVRRLTHEEFINECLTNDEFGDRWGCKIEIKELSLEERCEFDSNQDNVRNTYDQSIETFGAKEVITWLNEKNIPTTLITITYNDKIIESHEYKNKI